MTIDLQKLKKLAEKATPQNFDSAQEKVAGGIVECPLCGGDGEVEVTADYCNYDDVAIGVQFYGVGHHHGAAEEYYRAAKPATILALIAELEKAQKDAERYRWLRNNAARQFKHPIVVEQHHEVGVGMRYVGPLVGSSLDEAIDAAPSPSENKGEGP